MSRVHLYALDTEGRSVPVKADAGGNISGSAQSTRPWSYAAASGGITNTADVAIKAAAGAGYCNYLVSLFFQNSSATSTEVVVKDGSTVIWRGYARAADVSDFYVGFEPPLCGSANTALNVACITNATATYVNAQGFVGRRPAWFEEEFVTELLELYDDNGDQLTDSGGNLLYL